MPGHPWSDYQNWKGEVLRSDPHKGERVSAASTLRLSIKSARQAAFAEEDDLIVSEDRLVTLFMPLAKRMAARYSQKGADYDELESDATHVLLLAARNHLMRGFGVRTFRKYLVFKLRKALGFKVAIFRLRLLGVPKELKEAAVRVSNAIERLYARGYRRPNLKLIAGEANLSRETTATVLALPEILVWQKKIEQEAGEKETSVRPNGEPELVPIFGPQPGFTPQTSCDSIHPHGRIRRGSSCCCMACHQSGMDHHPTLIRHRGEDPRPERRSSPPPAVAKPADEETRKDRRRRLFPPVSATA